MDLNIGDQEIIRGIKEGGADESRVISILLENNRKSILKFVTSNNGTKLDAKEILLEGVTEVVFNVRKNKFKEKSSLNTYLFKICKLLWYQRLRKKNVLRYTVELEDKKVLSLQSKLEYSDKKEHLNEMLAGLGEGCQKVLVMWSQGFRMEEIAEKMGYAGAQIAMNKKSKCLKALKKMISSNIVLKKLLNELR